MAVPLLFVAAREGMAEAVRALLSQGESPEARWDPMPDYGAFFRSVTPLMVAAASARSNAETVGALLAGGADPFAISAGGVTALWYAAGGGTGHPTTTDLEAGHPYLDWGGGDAERLRLLLDAGLPASEAASNGRTALGEACAVGDPARVALLIERGASVWPAGSKFKLTELPEHVLRLLKSVAELEPDLSGYRPEAVPLFLAAESGSLECVRLVIGQGFPADFVCGGENALNHARTAEVAEFLLDRGVRPREGRFTFDSIDDAFEADRIAVGMAMLRRIEDPEARQRALDQKLLSCSGVRMNPAAIRALIAEGADARRLDESLGSPLHFACWQGDGNGGREDAVTEETVRLLIEAGADPNVPSRGTYPLHEAVRGDWESPTSVRALLEHGAKVDVRDDEGKTPLMLAAESGKVACVRLLLAAGADPRPAVALARQSVKEWQSLARQSPRKVSRFLKGVGMDSFVSTEETLARYQTALAEAREALALLEAAARDYRG